MDAAEKLEVWIGRSGRTKKSIADELGYSRAMLHYLLRGQRLPSSHQMAAIEELTAGEVPMQAWCQQ